jgi:predicted kinase/5-methylcytosine-specific restriction endonuclease McrA
MPVRPITFRPAFQNARSESRREYDKDRQRAEPWRKWYKLKVWQSLRAAQLRKEPLCENCLAEYGSITPADTVHHKDAHGGDWQKFCDPENLQSVCKECHDGEIQRGERAGWTDRGWQVEGHKLPPRVIQPVGLSPSRVPLTIVCGPPGAGKSTYIETHRGPDDIIIDIDAILAELSGDAVRTQERRDTYLMEAFLLRNRRLAALATETRPIAAWFIVGAPRPSMRELWANQLKPFAVVVMQTPAALCRDRILKVSDRAPTASGMIKGALSWWDRYDRSPVDTLYL